MEIKVSTLANILNGAVEGNPDLVINRPSRIEEGGEGSISFFGNLKYEQYVYTTTASALIVPRNFTPREPVKATLIRVDDVYAALAILQEKFAQQQAALSSEISEKADIHPSASLGKNVSIGPFTIVEAGAQIGEGCQIGPQVYIGKNAVIGANTRIFPGVRIFYDSVIGPDCVLHANVVIGSDGFGFAPLPDGSYKKIPQIGNVVIEEKVEIGANTTIDRAAMGSTIIRRGVKLDNLIQVAHNVEIGENTVIAAQVGIAGSTKIGKNCQIGGQAGFVGHLRIADGTKVQAQTGVASNIDQTDTAVAGYPAFNYVEYLRAHMIFKKLPELYRRLLSLEKRWPDKQGQV